MKNFVFKIVFDNEEPYLITITDEDFDSAKSRIDGIVSAYKNSKRNCKWILLPENKILNSKEGITIKELKDFLKDVPEIDSSGSFTKIFIGTEDNNNPCFFVSPLNVRKENKFNVGENENFYYDILLN